MAASATLTFSTQQTAPTTCTASDETQGFIAHQQWQNALPSLTKFIADHPSCSEAHYTLGYVLLRANQPDASLRAFTEAAKLRPPSSNDFTAIASDYILLKDYSDAQRWLLQATVLPPVNAQAWYLLGRTQYNLDLNEAAVKSFTKSLITLPEDPRSEYNLGLAYERLQQPDLARTAYETAIAWDVEKNIRDAQPYLDLGLLIRSQGSPQDALPFLQKSAALAPGNALILQELGRTLMDLNRLEEAVAALRSSIALAPYVAPPHLFLGRALRKAGKLQEADEQFAIVQKLTEGKSIGSTPNTESERQVLR